MILKDGEIILIKVNAEKTKSYPITSEFLNKYFYYIYKINN